MRPAFVCRASEIEDAHSRFCTCCGKPLKGKVAWLELDQRTNTYHDLGTVPTDQSQGWFPFGMTCAKRALASAALTPPETDVTTCPTCGIEFTSEPDQTECDRCWGETQAEMRNDAADARHEAARERRGE